VFSASTPEWGPANGAANDVMRAILPAHRS
jgi:hypothetical protein